MRYISANPIAIKKPRSNKLPPRFLTAEETSEVLKHAEGETLFPMIATALYTGMRLGELKRMKIEDVDFKRKTITIPVSKSKKFRVVPLHKTLEPILRQPDALPFNLANRRRVFDRVMRLSGLKGQKIGWHTFRHTMASTLIIHGVDIATVSKLLGHQSISTTQIYLHLSPDHLKDSIAKLRF
jgi:integrase